MAPSMCPDPCGRRWGRWFQAILYHISAAHLVFMRSAFFKKCHIKLTCLTSRPQLSTFYSQQNQHWCIIQYATMNTFRVSSRTSEVKFINISRSLCTHFPPHELWSAKATSECDKQVCHRKVKQHLWNHNPGLGTICSIFMSFIHANIVHWPLSHWSTSFTCCRWKAKDKRDRFRTS